MMHFNPVSIAPDVLTETHPLPSRSGLPGCIMEALFGGFVMEPPLYPLILPFLAPSC